MRRQFDSLIGCRVEGDVVSDDLREPFHEMIMTSFSRRSRANKRKNAFREFNDVSMISNDISHQEKVGVIDHYTQKLKSSGYNHTQCKELVVSGVVGYQNKVRNRTKNNQPFYRCAKSTLGSRIRKKLTEKNNWYKKKSSGGQMGAFKGLNRDGKPDRKGLKRQSECGTSQSQPKGGTAKVNAGTATDRGAANENECDSPQA